jgi:hypothetical protein
MRTWEAGIAMPGHAPRIPWEPQRNLSMTCRTVIHIYICIYRYICANKGLYQLYHIWTFSTLSHCSCLCASMHHFHRAFSHSTTHIFFQNMSSRVYSYKNIIERTCCQHPIADSHIQTEGIVPCLYRSAGRRRSVLAHSLAVDEPLKETTHNIQQSMCVHKQIRGWENNPDGIPNSPTAWQQLINFNPTIRQEPPHRCWATRTHINVYICLLHVL